MPDVETPNDNRETLSDGAFLNQLGEAVANLSAGVAELLKTGNLLLEVRETDRKQLDHIDSMLHEVHQFIEEHRPALGRALALLDPGRSMRDYLKHRPRAGKDGHG